MKRTIVPLVLFLIVIMLVLSTAEASNPYGKATTTWGTMKAQYEGVKKAPATVPGTMILPLSGSFRVTRQFGEPYLNYGPHTGIDLAPLSSSAWYVIAPFSGIVEDVGFEAMAGNYIVIRHPTYAVTNRYKGYCAEKIYTKYYHLDTIESSIRKGSNVYQGAGMGRVGKTGSAAYGAHLHFEIRENGRYGRAVNPREYIRFGDSKDII